MGSRRLLPFFCLFLLFFSCKRPGPPPEGIPPAGEGVPAPPESLIAVLRPGENPLWFDVSGGTAAEGGLRLIDSPAAAELAPFTPWPLAPHGAAMLVHGEAVYLALNRDGLLAFFPLEGGDLGLYRFAGTDYWKSYTLGTLFLYDGGPALFFYRDDVFTEPALPPPRPPVLALRPGPARPGDLAYGSLEALEIPALAGIPFAEGWEADILRPGADGLWYYRLSRRKNGGREARYFRSADLSRAGEETGPGPYRNSQKEAEPDASGLPPLPDDFVYTHVVRLGDTVIAAWEEQQDYNIGAAGFMLIRGTP